MELQCVVEQQQQCSSFTVVAAAVVEGDNSSIGVNSSRKGRDGVAPLWGGGEKSVALGQRAKQRKDTPA